MKKTRVIHINAIEQTVDEKFVSSLEDVQALVGGLIERVGIIGNGDELYADEEGQLKDHDFFFAFPMVINGETQKVFIAGNGYIIGQVDDEGDNTDAKSTVKEIREAVSIKKRIREEKT